MLEKTVASPLDSLNWAGRAPGLIRQQRPVHAIEKLVIKGGNVRVEVFRGEAPYMELAAPSQKALDAIDIGLTERKLTVSSVGSGLVIESVDGKGNVTMSVRDNQGIMVLGAGNRVQVFHGGVAQVVSGDIVNGTSGPYVIGLVLPRVPQVKVKGSADVFLAGVDQDVLRLAVEGSGDIDAEGKARSLEVMIAGSGDVDASDLIASDVEIRVAGSGDVGAHATESASVSIAGSGDVVIRGNPAKRSQSVAGSGRIKFK